MYVVRGVLGHHKMTHQSYLDRFTNPYRISLYMVNGQETKTTIPFTRLCHVLKVLTSKYSKNFVRKLAGFCIGENYYVCRKYFEGF